MPKRLADLVNAPVGKGKAFRWKTTRIISLLEAGVEYEASLAERDPMQWRRIRSMYTGRLEYYCVEIPEDLAKAVLEPVDDADPAAPSRTDRLIELLHYGLRADPHTRLLRRKNRPLDQAELDLTVGGDTQPSADRSEYAATG
ncbi:hypothetical protein OG921_26340 [Aldersonia sp. NBC_00410]|uniref:hypothetical protein n=1 Tax=Aldersonia sp. NBC_00410 TaxID=2975954 RepID=UPI00224DA531|nr:hypothetical protein [Aldersonia sp. NBC_00410]MCX5046699.1 hypothetical protein [Aldersonia sp. NBC_00410]